MAKRCNWGHDSGMKSRSGTDSRRHQLVKGGRSASAGAEVSRLNRELRARDKQLEQLEKSVDAIREETQHWRKRYFRLEEQKTKEIHKLELELSELKAKFEQVKATLAWHQNHTFGDRTEASQPGPEKPEPKTESKPRGKKAGAQGHGRKERNGLFLEENEIDVPEERRTCNCCGKPYRALPKKDRSSMLELMQELYKIVDLGITYVKDCECDEGNKPRLVRAAAPPRVFPRALLGPDLWADIIVEKFLFQKPLGRISQKYLLLGASIPVSTIVGGLQKMSSLFDSLFDKITDRAKGAKQWNMDETTWRVFGEGDRKKWWLWVVVTMDTCLYILDPTRSAAVPDSFFQGVAEGTLITDRYSAYKALMDSIQKAYCWAHVRRDFIKIRDGYNNLQVWGDEWVKLIDLLFKANAERMKLLMGSIPSVESRFEANYQVKFILEQIYEKSAAELKGKLKDCQRKALSSLQKHWKGLTIFADNPLVPMDNNAAERALRNPVVGRKNYYGSGSKWSGELSAKLFSIIQTWLHNRLDPVNLLRDFLKQCADARGKPPCDEDFLPWAMSQERKQQFWT